MTDSYHQMRKGLNDRFVGVPDKLVDQISFALCLEGRLAGVGLRVLLTGATGMGKSAVLQQLADASLIPTVLLDAGEICPSGTRGIDPAELGALMLARSVGDPIRLRELGGLLLIDDICLATRRKRGDTWRASGSSGRQLGLAAILSGAAPIVLRPDDALQSEVIGTSNWIVVAAGAFAGASWQGPLPTNTELVRWGLLPNVAAALFRRHAMVAPDRGQLVQRISSSKLVTGAIQAAGYLGVTVAVASTTVEYLAAECLAGRVSFAAAVDRLAQSVEGAATLRLRASARLSDENHAMIGPEDVMTDQ